jgi:hypothetical protein
MDTDRGKFIYRQEQERRKEATGHLHVVDVVCVWAWAGSWDFFDELCEY